VLGLVMEHQITSDIWGTMHHDCSKANKMHNFSNLFDKVLYMFQTGPLSIIRSISTLYTRNRYLSRCRLSASRWPTAWQMPIACILCWDTPDDGVDLSETCRVLYQI